MIKRREFIVDKDIRLKEISLEDVKPIFSIIEREREYLSEWLPFVDETREISYTQTFVESTINSESNDLICTIFYQNQFVGLVGLKDTDINNQKTEIGYWLSENQQHKGIITRACKTLINYAFDKMDINRIQLNAATGNLKSQRVAERLGFTREGIERDGELHTRGFVDLVVYSLLKRENDRKLYF